MRTYLALSLLVAATLAASCGSETGGGQQSSTTAGSGGSGSSASSMTTSGGGDMAGGGGSGGSGTVMNVPGTAAAINDCAPNDGKAYTIKIGLPEKTCASMPSGAFLRLSFYTHVDAPAGNSWDFAASPQEAQGIYQPDSGDPSNIVVVSKGNLWINAWDLTGVKGLFDVTLIDGTHLVGNIDAIACLQEPAQCG